MDEPPDRSPAQHDRLDSWKEIAGYLRRDVTTAQRWEKREGLPVHRHQHDKLATVYAFRSELDAWSSSRRPSPGDDSKTDEADPAAFASPADTQTAPVAEAGPAVASGARPPDRAGLRLAAIGLTLVAGAVLAWAAFRPVPPTGPSAWHDPFREATFRRLTDFDGIEQSAVISRDGRFVAFLSNRGGRADVWVTQIGTGQFFNLTRGRFTDLENPSVRTLGFTPTADLVTFWTRGGRHAHSIDVWAVPTLGGEPRLYLEGVAEVAWSADGSRVAYHTPAPGDPTYVAGSVQQRPAAPLFTAPAGLHAHYPAWSPDGAFIYLVQGSPTDAADIWRVPSSGGAPERITTHETRVSHPVLLDFRTLAYLATDADGAGPWLHTFDLDRRTAHRAGGRGLERYTSLSGSADGRRVAATLADPKITLWRVAPDMAAAEPISLPTGTGSSPRLGRDCLLYVASQDTGDSVWRVSERGATELWREAGARVVGGPEVAADGQRVVMSVQQGSRTLLYVMNVDGTGKRAITSALALRGTPSWAPDGRSIVSAVDVDGTPRISRIALDGTSTPLVTAYSIDPVWSPRGEQFVYTGPDIGTTFRVAAASASGEPRAIANLTLSRGARRLRVLEDGRTLVAMVGGLRHKDLWRIDLVTGEQTQLTRLAKDFEVRDFDVSADGKTIVLERVQEHSDVVLIELAARQ